ncbi:hypothetical protein JXI42_07770 [bacterium]|nr:hypothetical protein [bacterium]
MIQISPEEKEEGKVMAILAYIIFFVPLLAAKDNKFAMFHAEQGTLLFIAYVVVMIAGTIGSLVCIGALLYLLYIPLLVFAIIGIVNAAGGKVKVVPLIGSWGRKFNFVK